MGRLLDQLARRMLRRAVRRGLLEGNMLWVGIGAVAALVRLLVREESPKVTREELRVGEAITVRHVPPPPRGRRQRAERPAE